MEHIHANDGNCDCHYTERRKCLGGCGRSGVPGFDGRYICQPCEREDAR